MYFPLLRGRQNELLAVRELLIQGKLSHKIIPVIEPVKVSVTLTKTLSEFSDNNHKIIFIANPSVGMYKIDSQNKKNEEIIKLISDLILSGSSAGYGLITDTNAQSVLDELILSGYKKTNVAALCLGRDDIINCGHIFDNSTPEYTIAQYSSAFRRISGNKVILDDKFNKKPRNKDYAECDDEFFSDDHLYYASEGFVGFSDYSIVGRDYSESGFAPFAVAIHITYFDDQNILRIHHFVSKDNADISDTAGKFYQALEMLIEWNETKKLNTIAMQKFEEIYHKEAYPGLGMIKRLSIMHHIELVGQYLDMEEV